MKGVTFSSLDVMYQRLLEAARLGDVAALKKLLEEDPLILEKVSLSSFTETPLHVASIAGHIDFVKEILSRMPSFALQVNKDGFTPLHMAAARGHLEIVEELLASDVGPDVLCMLKDKRGRTPLHSAIINGRVQIIDKLLSKCPEAIAQVTLGETTLHLAVKNSQFEAFKVLFETSGMLEDHEVRVNAKDNEGKTLLEIAEATNQLQVSDFLKHQSGQYHQGIVVEEDDNQQGKKGLTFEQYLENVWSSYLQDKQLLPVMATMVAAATFQAGLNPPSTIWEKGVPLDHKCIKSNIFSMSINDFFGFRSCPALRFYSFIISNTFALAASLVLISFRENAVMAPILTMLSLYCLLNTYLAFLSSIAPHPAFFLFMDIFMFLCYLLLISKPLSKALRMTKEILKN